MSRLSGVANEFNRMISRGSGGIHLLERIHSDDRRASSHDHNEAGLWFIGGCLAIALALLLGFVAAGARTIGYEIEAMVAFQRFGPLQLDSVFQAVTHLGDALPSLLLISLVISSAFALAGRVDLALFMLAATALRALGPPLKWLFASPRPPIEAVSVLVESDGFGYPSGHAFGAALVYGAIALAISQFVGTALCRRAIQIVAMALVVLIALSRVRLGVHWPSDVAGGLLFGFGLLALLWGGLMRLDRDSVRT